MNGFCNCACGLSRGVPTNGLYVVYHRNFLLPLDSEGLLSHNMVHCLRGKHSSWARTIVVVAVDVVMTEHCYEEFFTYISVNAAALQAKKDVLLNVMNIFVTEPLVEWAKFAARVGRDQVASSTSGVSVWIAVVRDLIIFL